LENPQTWEEVDIWRKAERQRLAAGRLALSVEQRASLTREIIARLNQAVEITPGRIISAYFPYRGEPDLRPWMAQISSRGARVALPIVATKNAPLTFRLWTPEARLERGVLGIPVPAGTEEVTPDVVLAPCLGFDRSCYRLGYGGGYFDRTLAAFEKRPLAIGVAFAPFQIETIFPQPHDIPMDRIVTDQGIWTPV